VGTVCVCVVCMNIVCVCIYIYIYIYMKIVCVCVCVRTVFRRDCEAVVEFVGHARCEWALYVCVVC
jgi:hypothetical protein